mmetsp:Transcript_5714/g.9921  ORF Transcript_5714/g.9921 Transcript_5714/m.9921 type:complete len:407 (+) Transcript_5714:96-1316(+)
MQAKTLAHRVVGTGRASVSPALPPRSVHAPATATAEPTIKVNHADVSPLFQPLQVGRFELEHRMVYPPLTRCRAIDTVPQTVMAEYYTQRATKGGLVIAEGTVVAPNGQGYPHTPGIWTQEQVKAWKPIVKAVKAKGAIFFMQLWHVGRASHAAFQPEGSEVVGASALAITPKQGMVFTGTEMAEHPVPKALDIPGIKGHVEAFRVGARNAIDAGFDGVEIHGANGYLIDQFTKSSTNLRTDAYGGSIEARCKFALEVVDAVVAEVGADRVGLRLSPFTDFNGATDATVYATFMFLVEQVNKRGLAYLHMIESRANGVEDQADCGTLAPFRAVCTSPFITAGSFKAESGAAAVAGGQADMVAYGRQWIANPDLPKRFQLGAPLNKYDRDTFYTQGLNGYTDYPTLE